MVQKLTIVVTCTDRKSAQPEPDLMVRNLDPGSIAERVDLWRDGLERATLRVPLRHLYRGESWTQALRLEATARAAGFQPRLIVASAGLGLVEADEEAPPYAATFSPRQADSVGSTQVETRAWWQSPCIELAVCQGSPERPNPACAVQELCRCHGSRSERTDWARRCRHFRRVGRRSTRPSRRRGPRTKGCTRRHCDESEPAHCHRLA